VAGPAAPDKQSIAEPVEVLQNRLIDRRGRRERDADAFGAAAHGAADVQLRVEPRTARQHERTKARKALVHPVDLAFELGALGVRNARLLW